MSTINIMAQKVNEYQGKQVLINSDRLVFNAKNDSILLYSDRVIGFSTNGSFHFDTSSNKDKSNFIVNSPNIYLGLEFDNSLPTEPAVKGDSLEELIEEILDLIEKVYFDMSFNISYIYGDNKTTGMNPENGSLLRRRGRLIEKIKKRISDIKSENTKLV